MLNKESIQNSLSNKRWKRFVVYFLTFCVVIPIVYVGRLIARVFVAAYLSGKDTVVEMLKEYKVFALVVRNDLKFMNDDGSSKTESK